MSSSYYTSNSRTSPYIVDASPSRVSSARVCYHSSPTPLPTYTRVEVSKKWSKVNKPLKHNIQTFDQAFARASSSSRTYLLSPPQSHHHGSSSCAQPKSESNHYSLSRWANENSRDAPYYAPRTPQASYAQHRYEGELSREQPWNAVREVQVVRVEPRESRAVRSSTSHSVSYYDPRDHQLGGRTGSYYRSSR